MNKKQQNRQKYESFNYGPFEKMRKIFLDDGFDPEQVDEIDLSQSKAEIFPNILCLSTLENLLILVLANNQISQFNGAELSKGLKKLQILDISNNLIQTLDDLADMNLPELRIMEYQGNHVCTYLDRITQVEQLLCPKRHVKYNPVKVLTAQYNQLPVCRLTETQFNQEKKNLREIERAAEEFRSEELINTVSKYSHKNTLGKYAVELCPVPRKTRYPNLEYLNGQIISKLDVMRVSGAKDYKFVLLDTKKIVKLDIKQKNKSKIHEEYIRKYQKRINRMLDDDVRPDDPDEILKAKKEKVLDPKKFSVWQTPLDIQYKDSEFVIGIEDFKQQQKEHARMKSAKIERKHKRALERIKKKYPEFNDMDSEEEVKLFTKKRKIKPKMNLSRDEDKNYRSSESSLSENISETVKSTSEESQQLSPPRTTSGFISNMTNLKSKLKRKGSSIIMGKDREKKVKRAQTTKPKPREIEVQEKSPMQIPKSPDQFGDRKSASQHNSNIRQESGNIMLQPKPIPAQNITVSLMYAENRSTFDVHNKLSSPHPIITKQELNEQKLDRLKFVKSVVQKERAQIQITESSKSIKQQPPTIRFKEKERKVKQKKDPPQRELVKIHGDINKSEYQRIKIPLEEMIPTAEQGVPENLRQEFLFDVNSDVHKELLHYKEIIEESRNIREMCKEMDRKIEILGATKPEQELKFKASDYNAVYDYLKVKYKDKMTPYEMREVIYGANDYDAQKEPKIIEKEILEKLEKDNVSIEERQLLYTWIEILDNIKLKQIKTDEKRLRRIEVKEIERASEYAHLAYHYQKLKKYVPEEKLQKYVKMMGIPIEDILGGNRQKLQTGNVRPQRPQRLIYSKSALDVKNKEKKELEFTKQIEKVQDDKRQILEDQGKINLVRNQILKEEIMGSNSHIAQHQPFILEFLKKRDHQKQQIMNKVLKHKISFEQMMEQNLRKLQDQFVNQQGSVEDQMMKYAQEFKDKIKQRERLQANIKQYISETQNKLDEFWLWEAQERESRYDKLAAIMRSLDKSYDA